MCPRASQSGGKLRRGACGARGAPRGVRCAACAVRRGPCEATRATLKVGQTECYVSAAKSYSMLSRDAFTYADIFSDGARRIFTWSKCSSTSYGDIFARSDTSVYCADRLLALAKRYEDSATCEATRVGPRATENRARTRQDGPAARRAQVAAVPTLRKATCAAVKATRNGSAATQNRWLH